MGTGVAPNYANLFMDRFEAKALNNWPDKPLVWLRFIDEIFLVWTHGENKLLEFIHYLNSVHPTIKFTHEYSPHRINFLDTMVKKHLNNTLITTLYEKPTDTHLYLHYTSAHHHPCKTKGPYGQFLRLRRVCILDDDYHTNAAKLIDYYLKRGYPKHALQKHYKRASKFSQHDLSEIKVKSNTSMPVMVTNYNQGNPNIREMINRNWSIISNSPDCANIFKEKPIVGSEDYPT